MDAIHLNMIISSQAFRTKTINLDDSSAMKVYRPTSFVLVTALHFTCGSWVKYELTVYGTAVSWNTAAQVCWNYNGRLVTLESETKTQMISHFTDRSWFSVLKGDYWIGLYDKAPPSQEHTWSDCSKLARDYWTDFEPDVPKLEFCVRADVQSHRWKTRSCDAKYNFICERELGNCTFTTHQHRTIPDVNGWTSTSTAYPGSYTDIQDCVRSCTMDPTDMLTCWAVTFTPGNPSNTCVHHATEDPVNMWTISPIYSLDSTYAVRDCFEARIGDSYVPAQLINNDADPLGCMQPGSRTSTPEAPNTTTTPVDTTSATSVFSGDSTSHPLQSSTKALYLFVTETVRSIDAKTTIASLSTAGVADSTVVTTEETASTKDSTSSHHEQSSSTALQNEYFTVTQTVGPRPTEAKTRIAPLSTAGTTDSTAFRTEVAASTKDMNNNTKTIQCVCDCYKTILDGSRKQFMSQILDQLTIRSERLLSWKRRRNSAVDDRPSAARMGYTGILVLVVVFGGLVTLDLCKIVYRISEPKTK